MVSEMGSFGRATADTRSRSLVADRIRHLRIMGCLSPTEQLGTGKERLWESVTEERYLRVAVPPIPIQEEEEDWPAEQPSLSHLV